MGKAGGNGNLFRPQSLLDGYAMLEEDIMTCSKCGRETVRPHVECPRGDMKLLSREKHDEILGEITAQEAAMNRLLTSNVPEKGFSIVWAAVIRGELPLSDLHDSLMHIGRTTGLGELDGMEYKRMRNVLDEKTRKTTVKLRMTALSLGEKKNKPKKLGIADLRQREGARA